VSLANGAHAYGVVTRVLHWTVALLILVLIALGWWMVGLSYYDRWYLDALETHKALGMIALALGSAKVVWYLGNQKVALAAGVRHWERIAARSVHGTFLVLMVLIPCSGYLISTSAGDGISMFGLFDVPALVARDERVRDLAIAVHYYAAYAIGALALLHAGAALKHQFLDRDGTLRRMLW
jgi:cytochrome b561